MITEDYCDFETAKLLKEKGFDYYPDGSYWLIDANNVRYWVSETGAYDYVDNPTESFQRPKNGYRLVTLQMAMKWLREIYSLEIYPNHDFPKVGDKWWFEIIKYPNTVSEYESETVYNTYEEACEAAIRYCLTELI